MSSVAPVDWVTVHSSTGDGLSVQPSVWLFLREVPAGPWSAVNTVRPVSEGEIRRGRASAKAIKHGLKQASHKYWPSLLFRSRAVCLLWFSWPHWLLAILEAGMDSAAPAGRQSSTPTGRGCLWERVETKTSKAKKESYCCVMLHPPLLLLLLLFLFICHPPVYSSLWIPALCPDSGDCDELIYQSRQTVTPTNNQVPSPHPWNSFKTHHVKMSDDSKCHSVVFMPLN